MARATAGSHSRFHRSSGPGGLDPADENDRSLLLRVAHPELDGGEEAVIVDGEEMNPRLHLVKHEIVAHLAAPMRPSAGARRSASRAKSKLSHVCPITHRPRVAATAHGRCAVTRVARSLAAHPGQR
jgi:hypothetical protein